MRAREHRHIESDATGEREEVRQIFAAKGFAGADLERSVSIVTADRQRWIDFMLTEEYGLGRATRSPAIAALATFGAFLLCGLVPLLPFLLPMPNAFTISIVMTACTFALIGSARSRWLLLPWWRAGLETLGVGAIAAALAYGAGVLTRT